ncbi:restriction endonuclease subunit S [Aquicella lusitana]|uniref:Type I restriction enzyme S subunit n=1 Tax=Aquicella lusitana TaxID=254246 RepID=A0A370G0C5_9COXI|nr:restriction endonuclease subunit S [Aquicella lusitana]RDI37198.1 type I restriction enzyme S subunit [Aquicella lusitana]VVC72564.1 hypothetical protein AQULUS_02760 [Aquicella lusitana]
MREYVILDDAAFYSEDRIHSSNISKEDYVTTDNMLPNKGGIVSALKLPNATLIAFKKGDILVANIRPYLKKIWFATKDGGCSPDVLVFKSKNGYDSKFLYYSLFRDDFFHHMMKGSKGTKMPRGEKSQILKFHIPNYLPSTQKLIAAALSPLDSKIDINIRINNTLETFARTLYNYWFIQFDFPDKNGNPYKSSGGKMVWNKKLKREIPAEWEAKNLADIVDISNESLNPMDYPDKEFKHYSIPAFDESGTFKIEKGVEIKSNKYIVTNTDILVSKLNPWFRRVIFPTKMDDLICSTEFVVWRARNTAIKNYIYMIARDTSFVTYCTQSATGTSNSHKRVNPAVMMDYSIAYNNNIAELFGSILGPTIMMCAKNQVENNQLSNLRDWLLPMLMNKQVLVGNYEASNAKSASTSF